MTEPKITMTDVEMIEAAWEARSVQERTHFECFVLGYGVGKAHAVLEAPPDWPTPTGETNNARYVLNGASTTLNVTDFGDAFGRWMFLSVSSISLAWVIIVSCVT